VSESADQVRRHIEVLSDFEEKYGKYLVAHYSRQLEGRSDWSSRQWAERERKLRMLAPRAEAAIDASGVEGYAEMSSVILAFKDWVGFSVDARDDDLQREILRLIPSQIAGLHMQLEQAKEREENPKLKLPTVIGRIRHVPPVIGFIADVGGFAVVVLFLGRFAGLW